MDNASLIYESLKTYVAITALLGEQEDMFLDFKESRTKNGALLDDDKLHFSRAASGFAHQEGGVLVWGIEARTGANGIDEAIALKPIPNIKKFLSGLNDYVKYSTEPVVDGIQNRVVFDSDEEASDEGFAALFGLPLSPVYRSVYLYYIILALALLTAFVTMRLRRLPVGRAWEALREDEIACRSLGINTTNTKLTAFSIGAGFGGFAGAFFAARQTFVSPESFTFMESATILAIVVLGGMGSTIGVAVAAVVMIGGTEALRELDVLKQVFGRDFDPTQYRMLLFGFAMVLIMAVRPRGLISTRDASVHLAAPKKISGAYVGEGHG